jgi:3-dehydroquinate dehydratase type I
VITSGAEWQRASRLRQLPDFFELRLDGLHAELGAAAIDVPPLRAALIITARHPAEGAIHPLTRKQRRELLLRFLPEAAFVDVELRSAEDMSDVLSAAEARRRGRIISLHDLERCPSTEEMHQAFDKARALRADVLKLAVRTDTPEQLTRLLAFFDEASRSQMPISAMGIGKLGRTARIELARRGCALNYAHLGRAAVAGQLSLAALRRLLAR